MIAAIVTAVMVAQAPTAATAQPALPPPATETPVVPVVTGGLTADQCAAKAQSDSPAAAQQHAAFLEAAARVDEAWFSFVPRITGSMGYTRLSDFTQASLFGNGGLVGTTAEPGTPNPSPTFAIGGISFKNILNQYSLSAGIAVPVSDYVLRVSRASAAAGATKNAATNNERAARAKAQADARASFYNWLRALGAVSVSATTLRDRQTQYGDAQALFKAGSISKADLLRTEAGVAAAEQQLIRTQSLARLAERVLRTQARLPDGAPLTPGENLETPPNGVPDDVQTLIARAMDERAEVKALDATLEALGYQRQFARAAYFPSIAATGSLLYANPNQRLSPPQETWLFTWSAGAVMSWSPTDMLVAMQQVNQQSARIAQMEAQRTQLKDGVVLEVTQAFEDYTQAKGSIESGKKQLAASEEAYRVARVSYAAGRTSQASLDDVESALLIARLSLLNSMADLQIARVKVDHATGADLAKVPMPEN